MAKIYSLINDHTAYKGADYDGRFVGDKYKMVIKTTEMNHIPPWNKQLIPDTVTFTTENAERLMNANFPFVDASLDVLSAPLIETIQSVGPINCKLTPAHFIDEHGNTVNDDNFKVIYSNEHCDCFDYEQSDYDIRDWSSAPQDRVTDRMRKLAGVVRKLMLREPENGFPPYFRVLADPLNLYISEACYNAIIDAGHEGLRMTEKGDF